ncbi:sensor kinase SpoOB-type protein [Orenia metallireducens]|uniref:histidine kinase n=1 Tax=Orenia metallireducens TaxID=1413210 RepID=A0A285FFA5_9FIRM|nr:ATP-binding protein [Orenia metallireducens]PRX33504.1 sensor kinase SpoOB-type protein [Orenia metallireducens]SNY09743.1 Sensor_kinase_SpoOB-type, alpha-helical domain [Orenia metallireducens]
MQSDLKNYKVLSYWSDVLLLLLLPFLVLKGLSIFKLNINISQDLLIHLLEYNSLEGILELLISLICINIFLLVVYSYRHNNNVKSLFISITFLSAGIMNLMHSILVFNNSYLKYNSSSEVFAVSTRLIVVFAILLNYLIRDKKGRNIYYLYSTILFSLLSSLLITYLTFKLWLTFGNVMLLVKLLLLVTISINLYIYIRGYVFYKEALSPYILKGFIFLLFCESFAIFRVEVFSLSYWLLHVYKFIAFAYFFKSIFIREVSDGILAKQELELQHAKLELKEDMIKELRIQRHDFKNELQTIYTMLQLDKVKEAKDYIKDTHLDLDKVDLELKDDNIIQSVFMPKRKEAEDKGVDLKLLLASDLSDVAMPLNKVLKILFNLIDNAFDVLVKLPKRERKLKVSLLDKGNAVDIIIHNSGPVISQSILKSIFEPGYSTKGENRGFGLYIVKSLLEEHGGRINVESKEGIGTKFICHLPKI